MKKKAVVFHFFCIPHFGYESIVVQLLFNQKIINEALKMFNFNFALLCYIYILAHIIFHSPEREFLYIHKKRQR